MERHILVVEDDRMLNEGIAFALEKKAILCIRHVLWGKRKKSWGKKWI